MIKIYKKINRNLEEIASVEKDCWINISPPFDFERLEKLSVELNIPYDFLIDSVDINERSRYERDEDTNAKLIVINTPIINTKETKIESEATYITVPIGIILIEDNIVTISSHANSLVEWFEKNTLKNLNAEDRGLFVLKIFERNVSYYLHYLKEMNKRMNKIEKEIYNSSRNEDLNQLLNIQKSLVYFLNDLRANELVMMKIHRTDYLNLGHESDSLDFLQDIMIDNSQALEMANVYTNILNGTMDAFASIISNNLNHVMKRLTSVTIVLMLPTLIASFYGMNVKLPLASHPAAFIIAIITSLILSSLLIWVFLRNRWF